MIPFFEMNVSEFIYYSTKTCVEMANVLWSIEIKYACFYKKHDPTFTIDWTPLMNQM